MVDLPTELTQDITLIEVDKRAIGSKIFLQKFNALIRILKDQLAADGTLGLLASAWTAYTPTVTAGGGTFTTASATGWYKTVGKTTFVSIAVTMTTNGTASGSVIATLPNTSASGRTQIITGRELNATGFFLQGVIGASSSNMAIVDYQNTYPGGTGRVIVMTGTYENA